MMKKKMKMKLHKMKWVELILKRRIEGSLVLDLLAARTKVVKVGKLE